MRNSNQNGRRSHRNSEEGRGWYGDSRGHAEAAERGWEHRDGGSSRGGNYDYEDDNRGSQSRRSSGGYDRDRDDNRGRRSQESNRGWFGDSRGHAEAAERGWEHRDGGSSRGGNYDYEDDNRGSQSRRSSGRYDYEDSRNGRSQGNGRGWFGDSRGHAEAAEEGWENRGGRSSSRENDYDEDDNRGRRSRSPYSYENN